jgi:hypothetical protein
MTVPRALVITPVFDAKQMIEGLNKEILNIILSGKIQAQIRNTATINHQNDAGLEQTYLLFDFLDKGTRPHWIGDADVLLANKAKDFGPVWGPVYHPGTPAYDISTRTDNYLENQIERLVSGSSPVSLASRASSSIQWATFRSQILLALRSSLEFAQSITPDAWQAVRDSYQLYVNGRLDKA